MGDTTTPLTGPGAYIEAPGMFVVADKVDIRRFCWYPAYGAGASGFQGWRFFQADGLMEYRLNNMSPAEVSVVQATYLTPLRQLETDIPAVRSNLTADAAGPYTHNKNEAGDRMALFDAWRKRLCQFMGLPPGPYCQSGSGAIII